MIETPPPKRKTCDEMRDSLRKMGRKVSGNKAELEARLDEVFTTNDRGWLTTWPEEAGSYEYLASGAHRHVYRGVYKKGPRKGECCVKKVFKTGSVYESVFFTEDIKTTEAAGVIIGAFNRQEVTRKKVYLNQPEVWQAMGPDATGKKSRWLCEPYIEGTYHKFNSNTAYADEKYDTMQALSHFSYHYTGGERLLCDLQGGYRNDYYELTDPVICSEKKEFGATDLGSEGIENFFAHHRCNHLCRREWRKPALARRHFAPVPGTSFMPRR